MISRPSWSTCKKCGKPIFKLIGDVITPFDIATGADSICEECRKKERSEKKRMATTTQEIKQTEENYRMNEEREKSVFDVMESDIMNADIPETEKNKLMKNLLQLKNQKINLMITGATGCGKSSTINALFNMEVADVGTGVDPETMSIQRYDLGNLALWDSPGLGDGKEADKKHTRNIIEKLHERDADGNLLIDLVLVILDGSTRDLGTSYDLINNVIIPNLGEDKQNRILVAINQCDMAMKGRYWDRKENKPETELVKFLEEKAASVQRRIQEGTGVDVAPIYYSAGFKEEGGVQEPPYNLSKLLYYIIKHTPERKRLVFVDNINTDENNWKSDDKKERYGERVAELFGGSFKEYITKGADIGENIGGVFGETGAKVGKKVGAVAGGVAYVIKKTAEHIPILRYFF